MPWGPLIALAGSLFGGLFGNKNQQQQTTNQNINSNSTTNQSQQSQTDQSQSSLSRPVYDPLQGTLRDTLINQYMKTLGDDGKDLVNSTYYAGLRSANANSELMKRQAAEKFAAKGLGFSPASVVAQNNVDAQKFANIINLEGSLPQLQDQIRTQRLNQAGQFLQSLPVATANDTVGSSNTFGSGTSNTVGNQQSTSNTTATGTQGGGIGGGLQSLATTAAGLMGLGAFNNILHPAPGVVNGIPMQGIGSDWWKVLKPTNVFGPSNSNGLAASGGYE